MSAAEKLRMTYAEYLALEKSGEAKVQFIDGAAYAMAGGTPTHAQLSVQAAVALAGLLRSGGGRCRAYSSDAKIHVITSGNSFYPDLSVVCGPVETVAHDPNAITNPVLIVEVLSDSTESFDRRKKFQEYRRIPSLQHYVLVSQDEVNVEHFRRNDDATWTLAIAEAGGALRLPDLGGDVMVDEIYLGVTLPAPPPRTPIAG